MITVIPARIGSKRIELKNKRAFFTDPAVGLTEWTLIQRLCMSQTMKARGTVIVSSDDQELLDWCQSLYDRVHKRVLNCPQLKLSLRDPEHATDEASTLDVIKALKIQSGLPVLLMQPTSPFRCWSTFKEAQTLFDADAGIYVASADYLPKGFTVDGQQGFTSCASPNLAVLNGGWYLYRVLDDHSPHTARRRVVVTGDSIEGIDIDMPYDWQLAQVYAHHLQKHPAPDVVHSPWNAPPYLGFRQCDRDIVTVATDNNFFG